MPTCDPRDINPAYPYVEPLGTTVGEQGVIMAQMNNEHQNSVTFIAQGEEMLRCGPNGFFVRGQKVPVDDNEAITVYNAFREWLTWQQLNRG